MRKKKLDNRKKVILSITILIILGLVISGIWFGISKLKNNENTTFNAQFDNNTLNKYRKWYSFAEVLNTTKIYKTSTSEEVVADVNSGQTLIMVNGNRYSGRHYVFYKNNGEYAKGYIPVSDVNKNEFKIVFYGYVKNNTTIYEDVNNKNALKNVEQGEKIIINNYSPEGIIKDNNGIDYILVTCMNDKGELISGYIKNDAYNIMIENNDYKNSVWQHPYTDVMLDVTGISYTKQVAYFNKNTKLLSDYMNSDSSIMDVEEGDSCTSYTTEEYKDDNGNVYKRVNCEYATNAYVSLNDVDLYIAFSINEQEFNGTNNSNEQQTNTIIKDEKTLRKEILNELDKETLVNHILNGTLEEYINSKLKTKQEEQKNQATTQVPNEQKNQATTQVPNEQKTQENSNKEVESNNSPATNEKISDISINEGPIKNLIKGNNHQLKYSYETNVKEYTNNDANQLDFISTNESVATVDNEGNIKGVGPGKAEIYVLSHDREYSDYVSVKVNSNDIEFASKEIYVPKGTNYTLTYKLPNDEKLSRRQSLDIDVSKYSIVEVSDEDWFGMKIDNGIRIKGKKAGKATIKLKSPKGATGEITVIVKERSPKVILPVTDIEMNKGEKLEYNIYGEDGKAFDSVEVTSKNSRILSVYAKGSGSTNGKITIPAGTTGKFDIKADNTGKDKIYIGNQVINITVKTANYSSTWAGKPAIIVLKKGEQSEIVNTGFLECEISPKWFKSNKKVEILSTSNFIDIDRRKNHAIIKAIDKGTSTITFNGCVKSVGTNRKTGEKVTTYPLQKYTTKVLIG